MLFIYLYTTKNIKRGGGGEEMKESGRERKRERKREKEKEKERDRCIEA